MRELRNTIEKMVVLSRGKKLTLRDVPSNIRQSVESQTGLPTWPQQDNASAAPSSIEEAERLMIQSALRKHKGSRTNAAREVGISRRTLHRKLKKYQMEDDADKP